MSVKRNDDDRTIALAIRMVKEWHAMKLDGDPCPTAEEQRNLTLMTNRVLHWLREVKDAVRA